MISGAILTNTIFRTSTRLYLLMKLQVSKDYQWIPRKKLSMQSRLPHQT